MLISRRIARSLAQALRTGFQVFVHLAGTVIGIIPMIRNAVGASGVVVEAFSVSPDLTQRRVTGKND